MNLMGREWSELSALYLKTVIFDFVYTTICKYRPVSAKLGQNIYVQQNLNGFDHGYNLTGQLEICALELGKIAALDFVYSQASTNINQPAPNLVTIIMRIRSQMSLIMGQVIPDQSVLSALELEKLNFSTLFGI